MNDAKWLRDAVTKTTWFQELVETRAQERAMELLQELLDEDGNEDSPSRTTEPKKSSHRVPETPLRLKWFYVDSTNRSGRSDHLRAETADGHVLDVKRGEKRSTPFYWWHGFIDNVEHPKKPTLKEAKLALEHEVLD